MGCRWEGVDMMQRVLDMIVEKYGENVGRPCILLWLRTAYWQFSDFCQHLGGFKCVLVDYIL